MWTALVAGAAVQAGGVRTYLDHAALAPVRPEATQQVVEDLAGGPEGWANPSTQHTAGRRVGALLARARTRLASALGVDAHGMLLTSSGTEADALVVSGRARAVSGGQPVISPIEHPTVLDLARTAADQLGVGLSPLEVSDTGRVEPDSVGRAVAPAGHTDRSPASLVSVMMANNETGVVQGIAVLVERVREVSGAGRPGEAGYVLVHSGMVVVLGKVLVDLRGWGLGAMSLTEHRLGVSAGVGALVARRDSGSTPAAGGGRREQGLRLGTQDTVAVQTLALAMELAVAEREGQKARLAMLRRRIPEGAGTLAGVRATLPEDADHVASAAHLRSEEADIEALLIALDLAEIDVSAGSARYTGVTQSSHVFLAMGFEEGPARSTLCCPLGRETSPDDVGRLLAALPTALEGPRHARKVTRKKQQVGINSHDRHIDPHLPQ